MQEEGVTWDDIKNFDDFTKVYKNIIDDIEVQDYPRFCSNLNIDDFQYSTLDNLDLRLGESCSNDLKTIHINIVGIDRNFGNLTDFLNGFKFHFDVIVLSEAHLNQEDVILPDLHNTHVIEGYKNFYVRSSRKFGGVVIYTDVKLNATYINELTKTSENYDSVYVKITNTKKPLCIGAYYRHCIDTSTDKITFISKIEEHLSSKFLQKSNVMLAGDFNIDLIKSSVNNDSLFFLNTLLMHGLECHIFKPTRITYYKNSLEIKSATLIDQIASDLYKYECKSGNIHYPNSDHCASYVIFKNFFKDNKLEKPVKFYRNFKKIDEKKLNEDCYNIDWCERVFDEPNIDFCFENITSETENLLDKHAPLIKLSNRKVKYCNKPYIDADLLKQIRYRIFLFAYKKEHPNEVNVERHRVQKNKVTHLKRKKCKQYFKNYFEKHRTDTGKVWSGINLALEQCKARKSLPDVIYDLNKNPQNCPKEIANKFSQYFKEVPNNTLKKIKPQRFWYMDYFKFKKANNRYLVLNDCEPEEIEKHLGNLKNRSSPGPCPVPNAFLKLIAKPISIPLACAINKSIRTGYFPTALKLGKQTPVHKTGPNVISNFRPITVCSNFSKILEKVVRDRLLKFITDCKILNCKQFGFRKKHSTIHATINLLEATLDGLDNKLKVGGIFLDVSKAFDCVPHRKLLRKLEFYGIRDVALTWFESYLYNRPQYVEVKGEKSEQYSSTIGVPQGGVLSAILFIIFTNDIIEATDKLEFSIYADDTCLIIAVDRPNYDKTITNELQKVIDWFCCNSLLLNVEKTEYIYFGPHYNRTYEKGEIDLSELHNIAPNFLFDHHDPNYEGPDHVTVNKKGEFTLHDLHSITPLYCREEHITNEDGNITLANNHVKYLGIYLDENLKFKYHISILRSKMSRLIGIYWKCLYLDIKTKKIIYHSLVESHINYGIITWCSEIGKNLMLGNNLDHIPENLIPIKTVQNKILRAIFGKALKNKVTNEYTSSSPLYKELDVLKFHDLYYYNLGLLAYEYFHNDQYPDAIREKFTEPQQKNYNLRNSDTLTYKVPNLTNSYKKPSIAASIMWNKIPNEIKKLSKGKFKYELKKLFTDQY